MHFSRRYFVLVPLSVFLSLLTISCSESKVSQCNKIIKIANKAATEATSITNGGQTSDPKTMLKAADAFEKVSKEMEALNISDEKLQDYQSRFMIMYRDHSTATRDYVTAFQKKDRSAVDAALVDVQKAATPEKQLVDDINNYCTGQKSP